MGSNSYYIRFIAKSIVTSCITVVITRSKSNHVRFVVTTVARRDNRVVVTRVENNLSTNNYVVVNMGIKKTTTNFVYSKKLDIVSIWSTSSANCNIDKVDYNKDKSNFWIIRL